MRGIQLNHEKMKTENHGAPVRQRIVILDALRGFALLGIILANFPEFSLWTFQSERVQQAMDTAAADSTVAWLLSLLVDGKFYLNFSVLFGIGFSIILENAVKRGANGMHIFYRRMIVLAVIGLLHMMLLWSGDILLLYALMGMLLPLFRRCTDRGLLGWALFFLLLPVAIDLFRDLSDHTLLQYLYGEWWRCAHLMGISEENFGTWLRDTHSYREVFAFLVQGAVERIWEFVSGNRYFKVLGLFLIGYYIGRRRLYLWASKEATPDAKKLKTVFLVSAIIGIPTSFLYAYGHTVNHYWDNTVYSVLYVISVYPTGLMYTAGLALLYRHFPHNRLWPALAYPGRMALTNYLSQSVCGMMLFYGIGLGMGTDIGLWPTEVLAIMVFLFQICFSALWLKLFRFGPLEWVWRMITYGKTFPLKK